MNEEQIKQEMIRIQKRMDELMDIHINNESLALACTDQAELDEIIRQDTMLKDEYVDLEATFIDYEVFVDDYIYKCINENLGE